MCRSSARGCTVMPAAPAWSAARGAAGEPELRVGAGVASGRIVFGAVGDESRLEYTVIGDAVNRAAKLEKATKAEAVRALTTRDTLETARAQGYEAPGETPQRAGASVDGIDGPVDLVVLAG